MHPIYIGDYPPVVKERVAAKSAMQGFQKSRLPELSPAEIEYIRGTADVFGLNHYTTRYVYRNDSVTGYYDAPSFNDDMEVLMYTMAHWQIGASDFTSVCISCIQIMSLLQ